MVINRELDCAAGLVVDCPLCGSDQPAEAPECPDGHGADCPDRLCVNCGTAVFVNPDVTHPAATRSHQTVAVA